jgi:hypothetical protein
MFHHSEIIVSDLAIDLCSSLLHLFGWTLLIFGMRWQKKVWEWAGDSDFVFSVLVEEVFVRFWVGSRLIEAWWVQRT